MDNPEQEPIHDPVMVKEVVDVFNLTEGLIVVDGTVGEGGHAAAMLEKIGQGGLLIGLDRDETMIEKAERRFLARGIARERFRLFTMSFKNLADVLEREGLDGADRILLDLGFSSAQIESGRGFAFSRESSLDMRYDPGSGVSAKDVVNEMDAGELARIIRKFGEERWSWRIAKEIERRRSDKPVETTRELAEIAEAAVPRRFWRPGRHPATKLFQALRIYVNDELAHVEQGIPLCLTALREGGRLAVISYHSLEDRIVKNAFRDAARVCICPPSQPVCTCGRKKRFQVVTKKPVEPGVEEVQANRRARSAKLRAVEKVEAEADDHVETV